MSVFNKIKWIAGILLVFLIVLTTNLIDKDNFNRLRNAVVTIYEDRIVASDLIFEIALHIQEKELALATSDTAFFYNQNKTVNHKIGELIKRYEQTKLTPEEHKIFNGLKQDQDKLLRLDAKFIETGFENNTEVINCIKDMVNKLYDLSKVQLDEGKRQMALSNKTMATIDLFTQVEIVFLILMAVLVQIIILYKPKASEKNEE